MRDLPIENLDTADFEAWSATPGTEALAASVAKLKRQTIERLTTLAMGAMGPTSIDRFGGEIVAYDMILSLIAGETRDENKGRNQAPDAP